MGNIDLPNLRRMAGILDGIPAGTSLPHALIALDDAIYVLALALVYGVTLDEAREESDRILAEAEQNNMSRNRQES